jgi:sarcosine/dimethylglycine N-methyltransferase
MSLKIDAEPAILARFYDIHPINASNILQRLRLEGKPAGSLTEVDLAQAENIFFTDQNHIGGVAFVEALATQTVISERTSVLDLGCGVGGPARYLAWKYGCHVDGVDVSARRCSDGRQLTRMVNLQHLVNLRVGDITAMPVPCKRYDVVWGQGVWNHIREKNSVLNRWFKVIRRGGCFGLEDVFIKHSPQSGADGRKLDHLAEIWRAYLLNRDAWVEILEKLGLKVSFLEISRGFKSYCDNACHAAEVSPHCPTDERLGYQYAVELSRRSILGYARIVARKA